MPVEYHRGSCICADHELRITRRCVTDDLHLPAATTFAEAAAHPIVKAFVNQRSGEVLGTRTVGPAAGPRTVYRLGHGHDHRGATWHDAEHAVVWLCAYGLHRSGAPDDAFPYFHSLLDAGALMPSVDDYQAMFDDRARRFAETVRRDAEALLARARAAPGAEHRGVLGGEQHIGVVVEVVDMLEETYVAFSLIGMSSERIVAVLAAFMPDARFNDWERAPDLPTRPLDARSAEVCYRILRE